MRTCICGHQKKNIELHPRYIWIKLAALLALVIFVIIGALLALSGYYTINPGRGYSAAVLGVLLFPLIWLEASWRGFKRGHKIWCAPVYAILDGAARFIND